MCRVQWINNSNQRTTIKKGNAITQSFSFFMLVSDFNFNPSLRERRLFFLEVDAFFISWENVIISIFLRYSQYCFHRVQNPIKKVIKSMFKPSVLGLQLLHNVHFSHLNFPRQFRSHVCVCVFLIFNGWPYHLQFWSIILTSSNVCFPTMRAQQLHCIVTKSCISASSVLVCVAHRLIWVDDRRLSVDCSLPVAKRID